MPKAISVKLLLPLLLFPFLLFAQKDSTAIKLKQYKTLYEQGLINSADYDILKYKALGVPPPEKTPAQYAAADSQQASLRRYYSKPVIMHFAPVFIFSANAASQREKGKAVTQKDFAGTFGAHIQFGPAIKRKYFVAFGLGLEASTRQTVLIPVYGDFAVNILNKKITPFFHIGGGYIKELGYDKNKGFNRNNGTVFSGLGLRINTERGMSVLISPDYRMITSKVPTVYNTLSRQYVYARYFQHQVALQVVLVFY